MKRQKKSTTRAKGQVYTRGETDRNVDDLREGERESERERERGERERERYSDRHESIRLLTLL